MIAGIVSCRSSGKRGMRLENRGAYLAAALECAIFSSLVDRVFQMSASRPISTRCAGNMQSRPVAMAISGLHCRFPSFLSSCPARSVWGPLRLGDACGFCADLVSSTVPAPALYRSW
jgi:hypothetical protein